MKQPSSQLDHDVHKKAIVTKQLDDINNNDIEDRPIDEELPTDYTSEQELSIESDADTVGFRARFADLESSTLEPNDTNMFNNKEDFETVPGVTVLAISNCKYVDMTKNWLRSIETLHIFPNITILATDTDAYNELSKFNALKLKQVMLTTSASESWRQNKRSFSHFKWEHVLDLLRQKQDVLVSDVDMVWLENPFPYFSHSQYDMFISWDPVCKMCPSMIFFRSTEATIHFVKVLTSRLSDKGDTNSDSSDTEIINFLIENKTVRKLKTHILDPTQFTSGHFYFNEDWRTFNSNLHPPVIVHANGINDTTKDIHDVKVQHLKEYGLWYLPGKAKLTWAGGAATIQNET